MANGLCDKYCKGCAYCHTANGGETFICAYYLITNIRRPCPAGTGCTVKKASRRARGSEWRKQNGEAWAKKMAEARAAKAVVRIVTCPECGTVFETIVSHQKFCSRRCNCRSSQRTYRKEKANGGG